jgi:diacylglycerol kinase
MSTSVVPPVPSTSTSSGFVTGSSPVALLSSGNEKSAAAGKPPKFHKPRAAWRQRLVLAERGFGNGARQDSIFFVHIFTTTLILVAAAVLNIASWQWMLVAFSLIMLFVAELFNQALKSLAQAFGATPPPPVQQALGMSTAASMLALGGVLVVAGFSFAQRVTEMFGG